MPDTKKDKNKNGDKSKGANYKNSGSGGKNSKRLILIAAIAGIAIVAGIAAATMGSPNIAQPALAINGISCDKSEHFVIHTHTHLDVFVNGEKVAVPSGIGIKPSECLFWMHTHSADGIIHVESPMERVMTLDDFFDIWAQTADQSAGFAKVPALDNSTSVYVNGVKSTENYRQTKIIPNAEIAIVHGLPLPTSIPTSYAFGQTDAQITNQQEMINKILAPSTHGSGPLGQADAPITIVEFGDYQCNSCGIFHKETKDAVISNLVDTGKVQFLFKDFTLNDNLLRPRQGSTLAAEAAYCAGDQDKFWEYHDELYNNQEEEGIEWISVDNLERFALDTKVANLEAFSECLDSHKFRETVQANNELVRQLGIGATPTFIIISTSDDSAKPLKLVGAHPYASFEAVVNQLS